MHQRWLVWLVALLLLSTCACTHTQLRRNTIRQSQTISDICTQQVLNNLAMFMHNPRAVPHFAYPVQGLSEVNDSGGGNLGIGWLSDGFASASLGLNGGRSATENWVLQPVNDPQR